MTLDLNCDLGEGEGLARARALIRWVTSINLACGGHAGDVRTMRACVRAARRRRVRVGAHPGLPAREDFGRTPRAVTVRDLELWLLQQVGALERIATEEKVALHHIKLHGALYHAVEDSPVLAGAYLAMVRSWWPGCVVYARAGGSVARAAKRSRIRVWEEVFADRAYRDDGTLVPRTEPGALLTEPARILGRIQRLLQDDGIQAVSGRVVKVRARTICVHADTPGAVRLARVIARALATS